MATLEVLACPSHAKAFQDGIGEAMAAGVASAASDLGDRAYIFGDTGRVVSVGDMASFASEAIALLSLSLRAGSKAPQFELERFGVERMILETMALYE